MEIQSYYSQVPFKATNTWSGRLLCIGSHHAFANKGHLMDDPVVPYISHSNSATNISSCRSGSSLGDRCVYIIIVLFLLFSVSCLL